jgi:hypothetical protein
MRFLPGALASLVIALGFFWAKVSGPHEAKPPDSFLDAEVTQGDAQHSGSCYSLRVVLRQHLFFTPGGVATWTPIGTEDWMFRIDWVENGGGGGPASAWETMTFRQLNGQVYPQVIETSQHSTPPIEEFMRDLISGPRDRRAQKVQRCQKLASVAQKPRQI